MTATLLLVLFIGLRGFGAGCGATMFLRGGTVPDVTAVAEQARDRGEPFEFTFMVIEAAQARALAEHRRVTFPLAVGRMLLGGLLLVATVLALNGRPGSRALALQALAASAVFAAMDYALTREMRGAWIDMLVRAGALLPPELPERQSVTSPALWWMAERVRLWVFELGALGLAALALTRPRAAAYFQAAAAAAAAEDEETGDP